MHRFGRFEGRHPVNFHRIISTPFYSIVAVEPSINIIRFYISYIIFIHTFVGVIFRFLKTTINITSLTFDLIVYSRAVVIVPRGMILSLFNHSILHSIVVRVLFQQFDELEVIFRQLVKTKIV